MSAGDDLMGESLAGDDDIEPAVYVRATRPAAIAFDGVARDFPRDEEGRYQALHPVDAEMQMVMMLVLGGLKSSPTTGNALGKIEYLDPVRLGSQVRDEVRIRTKALVDRGDVTIDDVRHDTFGSGGLGVEVDYYNNRLADRVVQTARAGG